MDAYHQDYSAVSHSMLEKFRLSRPLYSGLYISKTIPPDPASKAMEIGTCLHALLLEPEKTDAIFAVAPQVDRRTKAGKAEWETFQGKCQNHIILDPEDLATIQAMAEAVRKNAFGKMLLEAPGQAESVIRWADGPSGLPCKARLDKFLPEAGIVLDVKTCNDVSPDGFARAVANFGYHRQAAHYLAGIQEIHEMVGQFLFLCVAKEPPYEVVTYELSADALNQGARENQDLLLELDRCTKDGDFSSRWGAEIQILHLPRWAASRKEEVYV